MKCLLLALVVACGSSSPKQPDAAIDAPPDVVTDAPPMATGAHTHYILDSVTLPTTANATREDGFDLDGDGQVNNQIGEIDGALKAQASFDIQALETVDVDQGAVLMLADFQATSLTTATNAGYTMYVGTNPNPAPCNGSADTTCRHHLDGAGTFEAAATPRDPQLIGAVANGVFVGGPGHLSVQLSIAGGAPQLYSLLDARAQLMPTTTTVMQGKIGGAISKDEIDSKVVPAMQTTLAAAIARDCTMPSSPPSCGCLTASSGANVIAFFDANHDCAVTTFEVEENSLFMSLLQPDLTIEGKQCLSIGFAVTGVSATFTP